MQLLPQSNVKPMELHKTAKYNTHPRPWGKLSPISIDQSPWLCQSQSCFHLDCHAAHNRLRWGFMALNHTETTDKKHAFVACLPLQAAGFTGTSRVSLLHSGLSNHFKFLQQSECRPSGPILDTRCFDVSHTLTCNKLETLPSKDHCQHLQCFYFFPL